MWNDRKFEYLKRKIRALESELADEKAKNISLSGELSVMTKRYEAEVNAVKKMSNGYEESIDKYSKAIAEASNLKHKYDALIKECLAVKKEYEDKMEKFLKRIGKNA